MAEKEAKKAEKKESRIGAFFSGVRAEFRKINWPGRDEVVRKTGLVVVISVVLGIIISVVDSAALQIFKLLIG